MIDNSRFDRVWARRINRYVKQHDRIGKRGFRARGLIDRATIRLASIDGGNIRSACVARHRIGDHNVIVLNASVRTADALRTRGQIGGAAICLASISRGNIHGARVARHRIGDQNEVTHGMIGMQGAAEKRIAGCGINLHRRLNHNLIARFKFHCGLRWCLLTIIVLQFD